MTCCLLIMFCVEVGRCYLDKLLLFGVFGIAIEYI